MRDEIILASSEDEKPDGPRYVPPPCPHCDTMGPHGHNEKGEPVFLGLEPRYTKSSRSRELILSALAWAAKNLSACPEAIDSKGHPMGWVPNDVEQWEEDRAAFMRIVERELAPHVEPIPSPAEALFTEPLDVQIAKPK